MLMVGPQTSGPAGLILNGGTIITSNLNFGAAEGVIYASRAGGTISSIIQGSGGLTTFGPGALTLTAANTFTGPVMSTPGRLVSASATGSATGSGAVTVQDNAALQLSGGTCQPVSLTMNSGSYLFGQGTIAGPTTIVGGSITNPAAANTVSDITFAHANTSLLSTNFSWSLNASTAVPADAGTKWSVLDFLSTGTQLGTPSKPFNISINFGSGVPNPSSGNLFWDQPQQWVVAEYQDGYSWEWYSWCLPEYFSQGSFSVSNPAPHQALTIFYTPYSLIDQWATNGSGTWSTAANWVNGNVPGAGQGNALFGTILTSGTATVTLDASRSLSSLSFSTTGTASYVISPSGGSTLSISNTAGLAAISVAGGSDAIAVPIALGSNLSVSTTAGNALTISGPISDGGAGLSLSFSGGGTLFLAASNSYGGVTNVNGGTLQLGTGSSGEDGAVTGNISVSSGAVLVYDLYGPQTYSGKISGGGSLTKNGTGSVLTLAGSNYIGATTVAGGTLAIAAACAFTSSGAVTVSGAAAALNVSGSYAGSGAGLYQVVSGGNLNFSGSGVIHGTTSEVMGRQRQRRHVQHVGRFAVDQQQRRQRRQSLGGTDGVALAGMRVGNGSGGNGTLERHRRAR